MITFQFLNVSPIKSIKLVKSWLIEVAQDLGYTIGDISYLFSDNTYILDINKKYLSHEYPTDIITFDYVVDNVLHADIIISTEQVNHNSITYKTTFTDELHRVIVHGILHLSGFNDKTEVQSAEMRKQEDYYLSLRPAKLK